MFENLKLFSHKGLKEGELKNLGQINVICGKNNSGKSTILEAISNPAHRSHGRLVTAEFIDQLFQKTMNAFENSNHPERRKIYNNIFREVLHEGSICYERQIDNINQDMVASFRKNGLPPHIQLDVFDRGYTQLVSINTDTVLIPAKRQLELSKNIQASDKVSPHGSGILNQLFFFRNQPQGSDDKELYDKNSKTFHRDFWWICFRHLYERSEYGYP